MNLAGFGWPDLLIGAIVLFGALKGFKRGFVSELTGAIALVEVRFYELLRNAPVVQGPAQLR